MEAESAQQSHKAFSCPASVAHDVFAYHVRVIKRPLQAQGILCISPQDNDVVLWRAVHNEFDVVHTLLIRPAVSSGVRVPSYQADLPASPTEITSKRSTMRKKVNMTYPQAAMENACSCAPTVTIRLGFHKVAQLPYT